MAHRYTQCCEPMCAAVIPVTADVSTAHFVESIMVCKRDRSLEIAGAALYTETFPDRPAKFNDRYLAIECRRGQLLKNQV